MKAMKATKAMKAKGKGKGNAKGNAMKAKKKKGKDDTYKNAYSRVYKRELAAGKPVEKAGCSPCNFKSRFLITVC